MRLNRRKNEGSRSQPKAASRRRSESGSPAAKKTEGRRVRLLASKAKVASRKPKAKDASRQPKAKDASRRAKAKDASRRAKAVARAVLSAAADVVGVVREVLRWPVRIWMGTAEALGSIILAAWRRAALPALRLAWRGLKATVALGERTVTPARGLTVVALAATIALGASQFSDYRAVQVGAPDYNRVESVASAPEVDRASPRTAHGVAVFAIAVACLFVTVFAAWRNWRLARLLLFAGLAVVAISLFADVHQGLDLGATGEAYQGTKAILLGAFWVQLAAGATLIVVGPLLALQLRGEKQTRRGRSRRRTSGDIDPKRVSALRPGVGT